MVVSPQPSTERRSPSERVVRVVAEEADVDALDLPPLHYTIDTDALDAAVELLDDGSVEFRYADRYVTVHGDCTVEVSEESTVTLAGQEATAED